MVFALAPAITEDRQSVFPTLSRTAQRPLPLGRWPLKRGFLVGLAGFEPTTFGPPDRRANQAAPQPVEGTP